MKKFLNLASIFVLSIVIFNITTINNDAQSLLCLVIASLMILILIFNNKRKKYAK